LIAALGRAAHGPRSLRIWKPSHKICLLALLELPATQFYPALPRFATPHWARAASAACCAVSSYFCNPVSDFFCYRVRRVVRFYVEFPPLRPSCRVRTIINNASHMSDGIL
jgi:hypothetical protein